jgi:hypothetical protein
MSHTKSVQSIDQYVISSQEYYSVYFQYTYLFKKTGANTAVYHDEESKGCNI